MFEVVGTAEFSAWYEGLPPADVEAVAHAITVLEELGKETPRLRSISNDPLLRSRMPGWIFELCMGDGELRVFVTFEEEARIVLLYGYDASCGRRPNAPVTLPVVAHCLVAAKIFRSHTKEAG